MATTDKKEESKVEVKETFDTKALKASRNATDKELETKEYKLRRDTPIGDKVFKKGDTVSLTEKGRRQFKKEGKI